MLDKLNFWLLLSASLHLGAFLWLCNHFDSSLQFPDKLRKTNYPVPIQMVTEETELEDKSQTSYTNHPSLVKDKYSNKRFSSLSWQRSGLEDLKNFNFESLRSIKPDLASKIKLEIKSKNTKGRINILNSKSERYFNFVERVAKRVFFKLIEEINKNPRLYAVNTSETILTHFDTAGSIQITTSSQNQLSETLLLLIKNYAPDPNPPKEAFQNDKLPFIFLFEFQFSSEALYITLTAGIP